MRSIDEGQWVLARPFQCDPIPISGGKKKTMSLRFVTGVPDHHRHVRIRFRAGISWEARLGCFRDWDSKAIHGHHIKGVGLEFR